MFDKVLGLIESGKKEGAKVAIGGNRVGNVGYFIQVGINFKQNYSLKILN